MKFKSRAIPVEATQFTVESYEQLKHLIDATDDIRVRPDYSGWDEYISYNLNTSLGSTEIDFSDWVVIFPNGEVHVVRDEHFKQRFEHVSEYTKSELSYASKLASIGGCE